MILEFLRALLMAGIPVGLAAYALFAWALRHRSLGAMTSLKEVQQELKRQSKAESKERKQRAKDGVPGPNRLQRLAEGAYFSRPALAGTAQAKWLAFGGGFYGVVGLLTYVVVELRDLWSFVSNFDSLWHLLENLGLNTLIGLLVEAITNFVAAIAWPAYWLSGIHSNYIWLWFLVAYGAYWAGARLALSRHAAQSTSTASP